MKSRVKRKEREKERSVLQMHSSPLSILIEKQKNDAV
jgi:hypothetical protein